jgi:hypothetical protein
MKANLLASAAATLLTFASLAAVSYNVPVRVDGAGQKPPVVNLPAVQVHASAAEMRAAAMLTDNPVATTTTHRFATRATDNQTAGPLRLLDSPVAMPYYSFGNTLGRATKE